MEPDCSSIEQQADVRSDQDRMNCSQILTIVNYYRMEGRICLSCFLCPACCAIFNRTPSNLSSLPWGRTKEQTTLTRSKFQSIPNSLNFNGYLESRRKWVMGGSDCGESCRCNVEHSLCALNIFESNHSRRHSSLPHSSLECLGHVWLLSCLSKLNANGCGKRAACSCIKLHTDTGYLLSASRPNLCLLVYDSLPWRFGAKYSRCSGFFCSFGSSGGSSLSQDSLFTCNQSDADHITLDPCTAPLAFTWHAVTQLVCRPSLLSPEDMFRCFSRCGY